MTEKLYKLGPVPEWENNGRGFCIRGTGIYLRETYFDDEDENVGGFAGFWTRDIHGQPIKWSTTDKIYTY